MWPLAGSGEKPGTYPLRASVTFILTLYGTSAVRPVHLDGGEVCALRLIRQVR